MSITTSKSVDVEARARSLGFALPAGLTILPDNFEDASPGDELRYLGEASTVVKLLKGAGIPVDRLQSGETPIGYIHNRSHDWALPVIFIGSELLKQSPDMIGLAIGVIQDYVKDLFKGITSTKTIKAEIILADEKRRTFKKISYEGDAEGLGQIAELVEQLRRK